MEKIKVGLYVKGNVTTSKGLAGIICARVKPDDARFDLSQAVVIHGDVTLDCDVVSEGLAIAVYGYACCQARVAPEHYGNVSVHWDSTGTKLKLGKPLFSGRYFPAKGRNKYGKLKKHRQR